MTKKAAGRIALISRDAASSVGSVRSGRAGSPATLGVVQPPVQVLDLGVELGREPVGGRDGDAEVAQRRQAEGDRVGEAVAVGQAADLHRRRVRALQRGRAQLLDACGTPRPPRPAVRG